MGDYAIIIMSFVPMKKLEQHNLVMYLAYQNGIHTRRLRCGKSSTLNFRLEYISERSFKFILNGHRSSIMVGDLSFIWLVNMRIQRTKIFNQPNIRSGG